MKIWLMILSMLFSHVAIAHNNSYQIAHTVYKVSGLKKLLDTAFGGGESYQVDQSDFYVVDLMHTSGVIATELYLFKFSDGDLKLIAYLPSKPFIIRSVKYQDGKILISETTQNPVKWKVVVELAE